MLECRKCVKSGGLSMGITDAEIEAATRRGELMQATWPAATAVRYDSIAHRVVISLSSGVEVSFAPDDAQGLENARPEDLATYEISPSGFGVHFRQSTRIFTSRICCKVDLALRGGSGKGRWSGNEARSAKSDRSDSVFCDCAALTPSATPQML